MRLRALAALLLLGAAPHADPLASFSQWAVNTTLACPLRTNLTCNGVQTGTFTRATSAWFVNDSNLVVSVASGAARFSPTRGVEIEGARTNDLLQTRDLSQADWTKTNTTAALSQVGHDGVAASASLVTATAANGTVTQALTGLASAARVGCASVKRSVGTGTVELTKDGSTWSAITITTSFARYCVTRTADTDFTFGLRIVTSGDAVIVDYAQVELDVNGSGIGSEPIPTTAAPVTRNADLVNLATTGFPDLGVVEAVITPRWAGTTTFPVIVDTRNAGTQRGMAVYIESAEKLECLTQSAAGGADTATSAALTWTANQAYHVECDFNAVPKAYRDHVLVATSGGSGVGAVGQGPILRVARVFTDAFPLNGWIRDLRFRSRDP